MLRPPNSFLQFWKVKELRAWLKELKHRAKYSSKEYKYLMVPTIKQTKGEIKRRGLKA